jgi:hypothetical protein
MAIYCLNRKNSATGSNFENLKMANLIHSDCFFGFLLREQGAGLDVLTWLTIFSAGDRSFNYLQH